MRIGARILLKGTKIRESETRNARVPVRAKCPFLSFVSRGGGGVREGEREERGRGASTRLVLGRCFSKYAQNRTRVSAVLMRLLAGARRRLLSAPPFHDAIARARARARPILRIL